MKGFTLIELLIVTLTLSILAVVGMPVIEDVINSHKITATVEKMKTIASASDIARRLPGGDSFNTVDTSVIAAHLNNYDANTLGMPVVPMVSEWGDNYKVTTTSRYAAVSVSIPFSNVSPFESIAIPNGPNTTLIVSHQPTGNNHSAALGSKFNKHFLYLE